MKNKIVLYSAIGIGILIVITIVMVIVSKNKINSSKNTTTNLSTDSNEELILNDAEKPYINLIPQSDGHRLTLKITNIPQSITEVEYDLIYSAQDEDLEIEKGVGGTAKIEGSSLERELLLGTESCTNGCKYKYDEGITGGTLTLNFTNNDGKSALYEAPFVFKSSANINKDGGLSLKTENLNIKASISSKNDYFILIKNYPEVYSIFSSGNGSGKVLSITPETVTKENTNLVTGDYSIN
ncbi:MAG: hypothetical protein PHX34_02315 [Candidatus Shapirobacteria bacterium]|nr:hypothetical protein [Candidatus Shapirobacteria bacterium]